MELLPKIVRERLAVTPAAEVHPDPDLLAAFAEDSLGARERDGVLAHLARCAECREVLSLAHAHTTEEAQVPALAAARPSRSGWLHSSILRWGVLGAACVLVAASVVLLRQDKLAKAPATLASKQPAPQALDTRQIAKAEPPANELQPPKTALKKESAEESKERKDRPAFLDRDEARLRELAPPAAGPRSPEPGGVVGGALAKQSANSSMEAFTVAKIAPGPPPPPGSVATNQPLISAQRPVSFAGSLRGVILGKVTDRSGAVIAGAKVSVKNANTGVERTTETNHDGTYSVPDLPLGTYTVTIVHPGFRTEVTDGVIVDSVLQARNLAQTVEVGSVSETVEVAAAAPALASTELPLNGRNVTEMSPGQSQGQTAQPASGPPAPLVDLAKPKAINGAASRRPASGSSTAAASAAPLPATAQSEVKQEPGLGQAGGIGGGFRQYSDKAPLQAAEFSSRWTISPQGKLQRSADQGKTWQDVPVAGHTKFRAVSVLGLDLWVGGDAGLLYHSRDGGVIWTQVKPAYQGHTLGGDIVRVDFPDPQHGQLTTAAHQVWTTSDAGLTWQKQ